MPITSVEIMKIMDERDTQKKKRTKKNEGGQKL